MEFFVQPDSIVRKIWGKGDTILFIFAGAAAEFALNRAVDWLYYTGRLPADPLGRLFSTVSYARRIVFSPAPEAVKAIDNITAIHKTVENNRGSEIPDWAYRDVLFMLIDYSIRSFELLERKLTAAEKQETFDVFYRLGLRMNLQGLPADYESWLLMRQHHMEHDLVVSKYTTDLFLQYKKHLGSFRYTLLKGGQAMVVPQKVKQLLSFSHIHWLSPVLAIYKITRAFGLNSALRNAILPKKYKKEIRDLDVATA